MASRLTTAAVRCVRVASMPVAFRPAMTVVRTMATASKKAPPPAVPAKKAAAQIVREEMPEEEGGEQDYTPPTTAEAKPILARELKEEMKENQNVINDDQSISQEYLTEVNGTVSVEAGTKDTVLSFSSNGYDIRVRWNNTEYEEPEDQGEGQFDENEQQPPKEEEEPKTGRIPFEIDVSNGKNTVRFSAESMDNQCVLGSMTFPDLVKEARAREAIAAGKQPDEADADLVGDEVDLAHMSDNSHDALQAFLESIKVDDQLAQFIVHHCLLQQRLAHQRVVEKFMAFAK